MFRDQVQRYLIVVPNSKLRGAKIEVLSKAGAGGLREDVDFNIGYGVPSDRVEALPVEVWEGALGLESALNRDVAPKVRLKENGDHAIAWRLFYWVSKCLPAAAGALRDQPRRPRRLDRRRHRPQHPADPQPAPAASGRGLRAD